VEKEYRPMAKDFKVGDHVEWNSEAGRVRDDQEKAYLRDSVQELYGACFEEGATVFDPKR
jgi:hypothetical protein